jgi:beta-glucosidase
MTETVHLYNRLDPTIEARVQDLLDRMTLDEKIGQLVQESPFKTPDWTEVLKQKKRAEETGQDFELQLELRPEIEASIRAGGVGTINSGNVQMINRLQRLAVEESRLGIPLLVGFDVIHGLRTIFPIPLAEASTWNPALLEQASRVAAEEAAVAGINVIFAPMLDISRDPRWGRIAEGAGEDPYVTMQMAQARVRGFQADNLIAQRRVAACPKHYVGYGAAEGGRDYNTVDLSERSLREVYLPPFKAAFEAGAGVVMSSFNEIGGIPGTCNSFTLRTILREEWQWSGVVISDYQAISELMLHGVAADLKEAACLSIEAGVDIDMESGAYATHLAELVQENIIPERPVDAAARRVLRLKMQLGLFENPYVDEKLFNRLILKEEYQDLALQVAHESMVLLKNEARSNCQPLLPLIPGTQRIALIGPLADNRNDLLGTWAISGQAKDVESALTGLKNYLRKDTITCVEGCPINGDGQIDSAGVEAAILEADIVVVVLGEGADMSGEAHSRAYLDLPGQQQLLLEQIAASGKPVVGVLMCGRPLVIPKMLEQVDALLVAWHGGIRAGRAVADILFGAVNPSGKLTASWPRTEGQIPVYYAHKNTGRPAEGTGTTQFFEPFRSTYLDGNCLARFKSGEI